MDFANLWASPLFCFVIFALIWGLGDILSYLTKGFVPGLIIASVLYLAGFLTGIIPSEILDASGNSLGSAVTNTTLMTSVSAYVIPLILVNLGTTITLGQFITEWKTVVVALCSLLGLALVSFTVSSLLFGREYALCAASPIAGGAIASVMTQQAAEAAGAPVLGAFAMLVNGFQGFIGSPTANVCLKKQAQKYIKRGALPEDAAENGKQLKINLKVIPDMPARLSTTFVIIAKVAIVAFIANALVEIIPINVNIMYLLCGILFCELGFLDRQSLAKANASGFLTLALVAACVSSFSSVDVASLIDMIIPVVGCLLVGAAGCMLAGGIAGKILGWDFFVSAAISVTCMVGYPATQIVTEGVCKTLECDDEMAARIQNYLLPKMVVGGFTTVTVASVIFAGIVTPLIF
ncbi:MAG: hypothetical protein LUF34_08520 [Lachnospiraceae bacterium]|nr:hypothetical protein [Lachnospiraceae bacterium]MCD8010807.1 hypothetical protein [Lachnospiraceae bacterium]